HGVLEHCCEDQCVPLFEFVATVVDRAENVREPALLLEVGGVRPCVSSVPGTLFLRNDLTDPSLVRARAAPGLNRARRCGGEQSKSEPHLDSPWPRPNGPRLSCGRPRPPRAVSLNGTSCAPAHNTPVPLKRSPPASFKRLLGCADSYRKCNRPQAAGQGSLVAQ